MRESEWRTRFINVLKYEALSASMKCSFEERGDRDAFTLKNKGSSLLHQIIIYLFKALLAS